MTQPINLREMEQDARARPVPIETNCGVYMERQADRVLALIALVREARAVISQRHDKGCIGAPELCACCAWLAKTQDEEPKP